MSDYSSLEVRVLVTLCAQLFAAPWIVASHAPLSMGFFRQEYCSELPFPSPLSPSSSGSFVSLSFLLLKRYHLCIWGSHEFETN